MTPRIFIPALMITALGLAACGKQGELDRPAPLFGKARAEYLAQRRAAARATAGQQSSSSQTNGD